MEEIIKILKEIDVDSFKGIYSIGEIYDLKKEIKNTLIKQGFLTKR